MRKAFSMVELVFVIVIVLVFVGHVIGVLSKSISVGGSIGSIVIVFATYVQMLVSLIVTVSTAASVMPSSDTPTKPRLLL